MKLKIIALTTLILGLAIGILFRLERSSLGALNEFASVTDILIAQQAYFQANGKYLQIKEGNALPHYEAGTVEQKLGKNVPTNIKVDVYAAPTGRGYQLYYEDAAARYSVGVGPESASRNYIISKALFVSSTTTPQ